MPLSKRNYEAVAAILVNERRNGQTVVDRAVILQQTDDIARKLADYFGEDNDRFDRKRFLDACEVFKP